jgi:hypothetical protein
MDQDEFEKLACLPENTTLRVALQHHHTALFVFFGDYANGAKLAIEKGNDLLTGSPGNWGYHDTFLRGASLFAMAWETKKGKFKRHAIKNLQKQVHSG